jgi:hypothetical protein
MSPEMRIGDAEREAAVSALGEHYAAGRLTKEEYDERAERAWAARTASQLAPLFADLPAPHGAPGRSSAPTTAKPPLPASRAHGFRVPLLPVLAIFVGVALLVGHFWVFWLLLGAFWWTTRSARHAARRREWQARYGSMQGWVQDWQRRGRHGW